MPRREPPATGADEVDSAVPPVPCEACQTALQSPGRRSVSFLLLDQLTLPVVGCDEHLEQLRAVCGLTTEERAELLGHLPAGGIRCPSCRLSSHGVRRALIPIDGGAAVVLGCPEHQTAIASRFQTGRETRAQLVADVDTSV